MPHNELEAIQEKLQHSIRMIESLTKEFNSLKSRYRFYRAGFWILLCVAIALGFGHCRPERGTESVAVR